jgi:hypothetical protein
MIYIFTTEKHQYTITPFLTSWPNSASSHIQLVPYEHLYRIRSIQPGVFIFSDIDRLTPTLKSMAMLLHEQLKKHFGELSVINSPQKTLIRYDLLKLLWQNGINKYRVYSPREMETVQSYPVFLRFANDHGGPRSPLIYNPDDLYRHYRRNKLYQKLHIKINYHNPLIAIEFCDTREADGIYRKYSSFRIGNRIIPGHVIFSADWIAKDNPHRAALRDEEKEYLESNSFSDQMMQIFNLANIQYGRIDFGLKDGQIQVWEINTNPMLIGNKTKYALERIPVKEKLVVSLAEAFLDAEQQGCEQSNKPVVVQVGWLAGKDKKLMARINRHLRPIEL